MSLTHPNQAFDAELRQLKDRLLAMGGRCEQMMQIAIRALEEQDSTLAEQVFELDREMNDDEVAVDDLAVRILALRQPVGRDLRFTVISVKVVTDLERIGDEAVNLAERARELARSEGLPSPAVHLGEMARRAGVMLRDALDAFVDEDDEKASRVFAADDGVDELYGQTLRACRAYMTARPDKVEEGMGITSCAKYLERIGDHATNIAEMVVFYVRGVDVRHRR